MAPQTKKMLVGALCVGALVGAYATGALDFFFDPGAVAEALRGSGAVGMLLYLLAFTVLSGVGVPSVVFLVPMPLVWPIATSLVLGTVGSMLSALLGFVIARYLARDFVATRLPAKFTRFDERLKAHGLSTVILVRIAFFLVPPATWFLALSSISWTTFLLGTFIGSLPGIVACIAVGGSFFGWLATMPPWTWILSASLLILFAVIRRRLAAREASRTRSEHISDTDNPT